MPISSMRRAAGLLLFAGLAATAAAAQQWRMVEGAGPGSARGGLAWHEVRGELVRFGGEFARYGGGHRETRVFDGARWLPRASAQQPTGMLHAPMLMTFDSVRGVVLLANAVGGELWEWDGSWLRRAASPGLGNAAGRAFAFDRARGVAVLTVPWAATGATYEWNGAGWLQRTGADPALVLAAAFVPLRGRVVGVAGRDLREWTGASWVLLAAGILPAAAFPSYAATFDSWRQRLVIFDTNASPIVVHEWDGTNLVSRAPAAGPRWRRDAAAAFDPARGLAILCGGETDYVGDSDTWAWDGQAWRELAVAPPAGAGALAYDSARGRLVATGAWAQPWTDATAGVWERDANGWRRLAVANPPLPGPMAFDSLRNQMVLVQPVEPAGPWLWNGIAWSQPVTPLAPPARAGAALAFDPARGEAVWLGDDTWLWNGTAWRQAATPVAPVPRSEHALAYDPNRQRVVLFGGVAATGSLADTWEWDGATWSQRTPAVSPPARRQHAMAFDAGRGVVAMTGGMDRIVVGTAAVWIGFPLELWDWDGVAWTHTPLAGPLRQGHAMAYDGSRGRLVVQGGFVPEALATTLGLTTLPIVPPSSDTWELVTAGATVVERGASCLQAPTRLTVESLPFTGNAVFALHLLLGSPGGLAVLGASPVVGAPGRPFGNGCTLWLGDPILPLLQVANQGGAARWGLPVPPTVGLRGIRFEVQGVVLDANLSPRASNSLVLMLGE